MQVVGLRALSPDESDALIDQVLGGPQLPRNARAVVHGAADGNPLFLEQALAAWIEQGVLSPAAQGWAVTRPVSEVPLPASVSAIIAARLDRLPRDERLVLSAASVAGQTFDPAALRSMLEKEECEGYERCLQRLLSSGLLIPVDRTRASAGDLGFEHASLREVAYEMSLKSDRARFHERFATWLENGDEAVRSDGAIGHHLAEACKYRTELRQVDTHTRELALRGARYLLSDSRRALSIGDRAGAERLTGRIVELLAGCGPDVGSSDLPLMERAGKLLVTMGRWSVAVELLTPYVSTNHGPLLRDLGVSLCQLHRSERQSAEYREGQRLLEIAGAPPNRDTDALASLAGTWKGLDDVRAQTYYRRCLDLDPADPYALGNVIEYEISAAGDLTIVEAMREQIVAASRRCRSQAVAGENLPWAFFDAGKFALLLGRPYEALASYAKAVQLATTEHMLATTITSLERLEALGGAITGSTWAQRLLAIARAVRFPSQAALDAIGETAPIAGVDEGSGAVMLTGGTDESADRWLEIHAATVLGGFEGFEGLIVSGGTRHGVAGLAGALRERTRGRVRAVGFLPANLPENTTVDVRYDELRRTPGAGFSIAETLQAWGDLIASGVRPATVKLLGVNGGTIAAAEYRVGLALGCSVGVLLGSGREADELVEDPDWVAAPNLVRLTLDAGAIRGFLQAEE
jgi:tetratricopeptide (TPR) repeat protein